MTINNLLELLWGSYFLHGHLALQNLDLHLCYEWDMDNSCIIMIKKLKIQATRRWLNEQNNILQHPTCGSPRALPEIKEKSSTFWSSLTMMIATVKCLPFLQAMQSIPTHTPWKEKSHFILGRIEEDEVEKHTQSSYQLVALSSL